MMKQSLLLLSLLVTSLTAQQINLTGIVTYHNSKFETGKTIPVQNATIEEAYEGKFSTLTRSDGVFKMVLIGIETGKSVSLSAAKNDEDLEVVNTDRLQAVAGQKDPVKIYMASRKKLADAQREYYRIGRTEAEKVLNAKYKKAQEELFALQENAKGNEDRIAQLQMELTALMADSKKIEDYAKDLAGKYAKVNLDDASALYVEAFRQFQAGNLQEALRILQEADLAGQAEKMMKKEEVAQRKIKEGKEELADVMGKKPQLMQALRFKADLHKSRFEWDSVEATYELLVRLDSNDFDNLNDIALFFQNQNKTQKAIYYYEKGLQLAKTKEQVAKIYNDLGLVYTAVQRMDEAETAYMHAINIREELAENDPTQFEPALSTSLMNLGVHYNRINKKEEAEKLYLRSMEMIERLSLSDSVRFRSELAQLAGNLGNLYSDIHRSADAEKMYLRALNIYELLAKDNPARFEHGLALVLNNLGLFYATVQKPAEAEKMYLRSLEIHENLAKNNQARFDPDLALILMNIGFFYHHNQRPKKSEKMYLRALEIRERLAKSNPAQFEPDLALLTLNLGALYQSVQRMEEAESIFLRSLEIYERLVKNNPAQFERELAALTTNLGLLYSEMGQSVKAEEIYLRSLDILERLAKHDPVLFEPGLAKLAMNFGLHYATVHNMSEAEKMYLRSFEIYERLAKIDPVQFDPALALTATHLGWFYANTQNAQEEERMNLFALDIYERLAQNNPAQYEPYLGFVLNNLAEYYQANQKMTEAKKMYLRSLDVWERSAKNNPAQFEWNFAQALNNFGSYWQQNRQFNQARPLYSRAVFLWQKSLLHGRREREDDFNNVYYNMAALRDSFTLYKDYASAASIQEERAACMDSLRLLDSSFLRQAPLDYDTLARCQIFARDFSAAEAAARRGLALDSTQVQINLLLAHALLLQGKEKDAKHRYQSLLNPKSGTDPMSPTNRTRRYQYQCFQDLEALRTAGLASDRDVKRVRGWVK